MKALAGRTGHIGGIEQITIDGLVYYFGFDYQNELVLSPFTPSIQEMALFASENMLQMDGKHEPAYWLELAGYGSELCDDEAERSFELSALSSEMQKLKHALHSQGLAEPFRIPYHLQYLLAAVGGWVIHLDPIEEKIQALNEAGREHHGARALAGELLGLFSSLVRHAEGNWQDVFSVLDVERHD